MELKYVGNNCILPFGYIFRFDNQKGITSNMYVPTNVNNDIADFRIWRFKGPQILREQKIVFPSNKK